MGDDRKPLSPGWEEEVADPLLREDICAAVLATLRAGFAARQNWPSDWRIWRHAARNESAGKASGRGRSLPGASARRRACARPWIAFACVLVLGLGASLYFLHGKVTQPPAPTLKSVAVLPFQNAGTDRSFDYKAFACR